MIEKVKKQVSELLDKDEKTVAKYNSSVNGIIMLMKVC